MIRKNILLTGRPGVGKTTLIKKLIDRCSHLALTGSSAVFARRDFRGPAKHRVGKYIVKPEVLERLILPHLEASRKGADLVVVDEIAKMELLSNEFRRKLLELLDSPRPLLATIAVMGSGIIKEIKKREDVYLFTVTPQNRNVLDAEIYRRLVQILRVEN